MRPIVLVGCASGFEERIVAAVDDEAKARLRRWSDALARSGTVSGLLTYDPAVVILGSGLGESDALAGHLMPGLDPSGVPRELSDTTLTFRYNNREEFQSVLDRVMAHLKEVR